MVFPVIFFYSKRRTKYEKITVAYEIFFLIRPRSLAPDSEMKKSFDVTFDLKFLDQELFFNYKVSGVRHREVHLVIYVHESVYQRVIPSRFIIVDK